MNADNLMHGSNPVFRPKLIPQDQLEMTGGIGLVTIIPREESNGTCISEARNRFQTIVDSAPVLLWTSALDKLRNFFNQRWLDFTGRSLQQEMGNGWADGLHAEDLQHCLSAYAKAFDERRPFVLQYRLRRHDGQYRWISDNGVPDYDLSGAFRGYVGSCLDVTDQKSVQDALAEAKAEIIRLKESLPGTNDHASAASDLNRSDSEIIGTSAAIRGILIESKQVAATDSTVLISGETGTGKELIAKEIHRLSRRKDRPMVLVNCAALPTALVECELFGREKGAYTGALTSQVGRFELANNSTIFLDEVGELTMEVQAKLLRVLQQGEFQRLGSPKTHKVNVRVIAATNRDLVREVRKGKFREDLYYRLSVFPVEIPPLRERIEDIPLLVFAFMAEFSTRMGKKVSKLPRNAMEQLQKHTWPGNIRELRNVIEHSLIVSSGEVMNLSIPGEAPIRNSTEMTLADVEREHITDTLRLTGWRIKGPRGAAARLDLNPSTLYSRMRKLGIPHRQQQGRNWPFELIPASGAERAVPNWRSNRRIED